MSNDLSFVIDPGGVAGVRPGINLRVFPAGATVADFQSYGTAAERLANSGLSSGGFENLYDFQFTCYLDREDFRKLKGLMLWNQNERLRGRPWEVIVYNFAEPFVETAILRSRFKVPGTNVISEIDLGLNGLKEWEYWVALQGSLLMEYSQIGSKFEVALAFQEGTLLTADMEP